MSVVLVSGLGFELSFPTPYDVLVLFLLQTPVPPCWKLPISDRFCIYELSVFLFYTTFKRPVFFFF